MQVVIMAGGKGTRFQEVSAIIPKLLIPIAGKPLLDHLIDHLKKNEIDNVIISTGHLGEKVSKYLTDKNYGLSISVSQEEKPMGTAGALHLIKDKLEDEFFIIYGDEYTTINLKKMLKFHKGKHPDATLAIHRSDHPQDSTVVKINGNGKIITLVEKPGESWRKYGNLTITPLYILEKTVLNFIDKDREVDLSRDVFPKMLKSERSLFGYKTEEYVKDIGTPKRYMEVENYIKTKT